MEIISAGLEQIDRINPLWEKLYEYNDALHQHYFNEGLPRSWAQIDQAYKDRLGQKKIKLDLVQEARCLIGYCLSSINPSREGEIISIFILPVFRSRGLGTQLMRDHLYWLRAGGAKTIFLYVHPCNTGAIRFYWRFHFFSNSPMMELPRGNGEKAGVGLASALTQPGPFSTL